MKHLPDKRLAENRKTLALFGISLVILIWGVGPFLTLWLYRYYSPTIRLVAAQVILIPTYLILSRHHLRAFSRTYLKLGIPTGFFLAIADAAQKIGLQYTTPAKYAFLENLSCLTVPLLMYVLVRKKPTGVTRLSCICCLAGTYVLNATSAFGILGTWGVGEILCAAAGLLYGVNIAATGAYAKQLYAPLYLAVQAVVQLVAKAGFAVALHLIRIPTASGVPEPIERIRFSFQPWHLAALAAVALVSQAFGWTVRTNCMKYLEASRVAVMMPFSAVVTGIISVCAGTDRLTWHLVLGGGLCLSAILLSGLDEKKPKNSFGLPAKPPPQPARKTEKKGAG